MTSLFFLGNAGPCHISLYIPDSSPSGWVLCFPPFAEEMNKSRTMMSAQARDLADSGLAVVVPDLFGTGDSSGDFSEANWETWSSDMIKLVQWIRDQGGDKLYFLGIRLGSLLALDVASKLDKPVNGMLLWQPVTSGQQAMTQFLRLRMAATMMSGEQEKVSDLRNQLEQGESLEVAGYKISPGLVHVVDGLSMREMVPQKGIPVAWFEISRGSEKPLSMVCQKITGAWRRGGVDVQARTVVGDHFWMSQEITIAPKLIQLTTETIRDLSPEINGRAMFELNDLPEVPSFQEQAFRYECQGEMLSGILHRGDESNRRGVLVVVGGPQYRVGSHRQFVLLARYLTDQGIPVLRFDYRGMGDSSGEYVGFEAIGNDIHSAIDHFQNVLPKIEEVVIWGLCDAATAAAFYAPDDKRVKGLVLLNPWVRSEQGEAKAFIKHYYLNRILSRAFWSKVINGDFLFFDSLLSLRQMIRKSVSGHPDPDRIRESDAEKSNCQSDDSLAWKLETALGRFKGRVLLILSGNDLTAAEFNDAVKSSSKFQKTLQKEEYKIELMDEADHTFSRKVWRDSVASITSKWMKSW